MSPGVEKGLWSRIAAFFARLFGSSEGGKRDVTKWRKDLLEAEKQQEEIEREIDKLRLKERTITQKWKGASDDMKARWAREIKSLRGSIKIKRGLQTRIADQIDALRKLIEIQDAAKVGLPDNIEDMTKKLQDEVAQELLREEKAGEARDYADVAAESIGSHAELDEGAAEIFDELNKELEADEGLDEGLDEQPSAEAPDRPEKEAPKKEKEKA